MHVHLEEGHHQFDQQNLHFAHHRSFCWTFPLIVLHTVHSESPEHDLLQQGKKMYIQGSFQIQSSVASTHVDAILNAL